MTSTVQSNKNAAWAGSVLIAAMVLLGAAASYTSSRPASPQTTIPEAETPMSPHSLSQPAQTPASPRVATGKVEHADEANFESLVLTADVPVLVDFYATWCRPCQALSPVLEDLAREMPEARVVKVNVDDSPVLASRYDVDGIPSLKVFKNGQIVAQHAGLTTKSHLKSLLR